MGASRRGCCPEPVPEKRSVVGLTVGRAVPLKLWRILLLRALLPPPVPGTPLPQTNCPGHCAPGPPLSAGRENPTAWTIFIMGHFRSLSSVLSSSPSSSHLQSFYKRIITPTTLKAENLHSYCNLAYTTKWRLRNRLYPHKSILNGLLSCTFNWASS